MSPTNGPRRVPLSVSSGSTKVKAILRVRPFLPHEHVTRKILQVTEESAKIVNPRNHSELLTYKFDGCYGMDCSQMRIFAQDVVPIIDKTLDGYNATIFAYGNTGAGKTFTMEGTESCPVQYLLEKLRKNLPNPPNQFPTPMSELKISYLEIYKEKVYDLLANNPTIIDLPIREDANHNILVPDLTSMKVWSLTDFERLWTRGVSNRRTAATRLNAHSSRSHSCLTIQLSAISTKLHLIDLAGSEDNRRTANVGERLVESGAINKSLFVLGQVVDALNSGASRIPYRDSKLTRLLQDSLGGRTFALIIANVAPTEAFLLETNNTLNFASKTRQIENSVILAKDLKRLGAERDEEPIQGKRIKTSSPATISSADVGLKRQFTAKDENNPFEAKNNNSLQSMILERRIEEKVAEKLRQISKGTILSPLFKGDTDALLGDGQSPLSKALKEVNKVSKAPRKARISRKAEGVAIDPHIEQLLPLVEPELLRILNYGTTKDIRELNEIGAKRAQAIIEYRNMHGDVHNLVELVEGKVISGKVMTKIVLGNAIRHIDFVSLQPEMDRSKMDDSLRSRPPFQDLL